MLDRHASDVEAMQRSANQESTMTVEVVCTGEASHSPVECVARGIAVHTQVTTTMLLVVRTHG
jgi:hypothetical protein